MMYRLYVVYRYINYYKLAVEKDRDSSFTTIWKPGYFWVNQENFNQSHRIDTGPEVSLRRYFVRNFTSADVKIRHHMTPSWSAHARKFFIGKHRYKVPCALQDGVIARKKLSDVFLQPKHIGVSLLVWYLFCARAVKVFLSLVSIWS
jgi:hypothetical protein